MMLRRTSLIFTGLVVVVAVIAVALYVKPSYPALPYSPATAAPPIGDTGWLQYGGGAGGTHYSSLDQINRSNVGRLKLAWSFQAGELANIKSGKVPFNPWESTPILAGGNLIACTPGGRTFALDPITGVQKWTVDPHVKLSEIGHAFVKCRGVSSFEDMAKPGGASCRTRVIWGTGDLRVLAVDARTGERCADFGVNGEIQFDAVTPLEFPNEVQIHSPPAIVGDVAVFGSTMADNFRVNAPSGMIRAIDSRTGRLLWTFDPVPRDDSDPAAASWGKGSTKYVGAGNAWSMLSADPEHGLVFVPTTSPSVDFFGGYRPGENRYTDSLVALNAHSGKIVWHFQFVHHDLWDYDVPAQPIVVDLMHEGVRTPAVIQLTKQGMVFVFNRLTGEPLFPVEERPVPQHSDVPGEWLSPTQPFSSLPPIVQQGLKPEEAWGFTFWDRNQCKRKIAALRNDGIYTPPGMAKGTIYMPASAGGANWGGGAVDPVSGILIVSTLHIPAIMQLVPREQVDPNDYGTVLTHLNFFQKGTPYVAQLSFLLSPLGVPCSAPPWGRLTALDLVTGKIKWQQPLGSIEKQIPLLHFPWELGTPQAGGAIMTKGGIAFIAASTDDNFHAFDVATGQKLWQTRLPAGGQSTPMTYMVAGKQYVVIVAGGHPYYQTTQGDYVLAYTLGP
jgi:quinoprotein glucose dehydrogenase